MILDIEMLRSFYASYSESVAQAKATVKRPLTYAEKVLFAHIKEVWNMLTSDLIAWRCRMRLRKWHSCSS